MRREAKVEALSAAAEVEGVNVVVGTLDEGDTVSL